MASSPHHWAMPATGALVLLSTGAASARFAIIIEEIPSRPTGMCFLLLIASFLNRPGCGYKIYQFSLFAKLEFNTCCVNLILHPEK